MCRRRAACKQDGNDGQSVKLNHAGNFVNSKGEPKATVRRIGLGRRELAVRFHCWRFGCICNGRVQSISILLCRVCWIHGIDIVFVRSAEAFHQCGFSLLVDDGEFIRFTSAFSEEGLMNLAHLARVVRSSYPIDWDAAYTAIKGKRVFIVAADCETGEPHYLQPEKGNWMRLVLASCTLPFVTRGRIQVGGRWVFDGGYADAIPLNRSLEDGNKRIVVVRTRPSGLHVEQGTLDWLASYWFRDNEAMAKLFESSHDHYNSVVDQLRDEGNGTLAWAPGQKLHLIHRCNPMGTVCPLSTFARIIATEWRRGWIGWLQPPSNRILI